MSRGRPPLEPSDRRSAVFNLRLTPRERAAVRRFASDAGVSCSEWMRAQLLTLVSCNTNGSSGHAACDSDGVKGAIHA